MKTFALLDIGERAGSGFPEILSTWKYKKWPEPIVEESGDNVDRTKVTLMLNEAVNDAENEAVNDAENEAVNDAEKSLEGRISALIKANPKISKIKMAEKLNVSKATIERTIKASKKIKRVGPDKGGHWEIIE